MASAFFVKKYLPVLKKYLLVLTKGKFPKWPYFYSFILKFQTFHNIVSFICRYVVPARSVTKNPDHDGCLISLAPHGQLCNHSDSIPGQVNLYSKTHSTTSIRDTPSGKRGPCLKQWGPCLKQWSPCLKQGVPSLKQSASQSIIP